MSIKGTTVLSRLMNKILAAQRNVNWRGSTPSTSQYNLNLVALQLLDKLCNDVLLLEVMSAQES